MLVLSGHDACTIDPSSESEPEQIVEAYQLLCRLHTTIPTFTAIPNSAAYLPYVRAASDVTDDSKNYGGNSCSLHPIWFSSVEQNVGVDSEWDREVSVSTSLSTDKPVVLLEHESSELSDGITNLIGKALKGVWGSKFHRIRLY